jgi:transcriptional regulator with XRE-family HTH domain
MSTIVSRTTQVRKCASASGCYDRIQAWQTDAVDTLAKRMTWLLEHLQINASALSLKVGLSRSHIGKVASGYRKTINSGTAASIATATGVSARWLLTGDGEAFTLDSAENVRYPTLWRVLAMFPGRWEGDVVQAAKSIRLDFDGDPDFEAWVIFLDRLKSSHETLQREVLWPKGDPLDGLQKRSRF